MMGWMVRNLCVLEVAQKDESLVEVMGKEAAVDSKCFRGAGFLLLLGHDGMNPIVVIVVVVVEGRRK